MSADYTAMWQELGLDLEAHDGLLTVLGAAYRDIYLSQQNRPEAMAYFDFCVSGIHGLRIKELMEAQAEGRKVVGSFCLYVPEEIILAAKGISVGLCAGADLGTGQSGRLLPNNTCALIRSFVDFKLAKVCPYFEASDLVIGETTCDGKKKAYEILGELHNTFVLEVPHTKSASARALWRSEIGRLVGRVKELSGVTITAEGLAEGIRIVNAKRAALQRLARLRAAEPAPISGRDALLINQIQFYDDPVRFTESVHALCDELDGRVAEGEGVAPSSAPRVLVSGCPMAAPNWKVPFLVERNGGVIVGEESCVGERGTRNEVAEGGSSCEKMLDAIAERYLQIDCAVFTPNEERIGHIIEMARDLNADGVLQYVIQFCTPYSMETHRVEEAMRQEGLPLLKLETDYSMEDAGALETRIQAFLEMLTARSER
ncbi:MAG: 2-hydroxyacyl-CoA dehydratase [Armatimonadetes bacterium]|nr:2-hydroxyacyl-CoA dehydratase [Armatimonadota bacterium]